MKNLKGEGGKPLSVRYGLILENTETLRQELDKQAEQIWQLKYSQKLLGLKVRNC